MSEPKTINVAELFIILHKEINKHGLRQFCRKHNLNPGNVSNVASLNRPMQPSIAKALGYETVTRYEPRKITNTD